VRDFQGIYAEAFALPYSRISHVFRLGYSPVLPIIAGAILGIPVGGIVGGVIGDFLSPVGGGRQFFGEYTFGGVIIGMIVGGVAGGYVGDALTPKDRDVYLNDPKDILFLKSISRFPYEDSLRLKEIK
jgi:hypothetical protein